MHTLYYALIFVGLYVILALILVLFWQLTMKLPLQQKSKNVLFTLAILIGLSLISALKGTWLHIFEVFNDYGFEIIRKGMENKLEVFFPDGSRSFKIETDIDKSLTATYIFVIAYLANTLLGYFVWNGILIDKETRQPLVPSFLQQIVGGLMFAIALLASVALYYPDLLSGTATTLGASGAIGAFVAADPIKKAITAISLNINKPIKKGDYISMPDAEGTVDSIGWRAIRLISNDNNLLTVPTQNFLNSNYVNHAKPTFEKLVDIPVIVRSTLAPDKIRTLLKRCGNSSQYVSGNSIVNLVKADSVFSEYLVSVNTKQNNTNFVKNDVLSSIWYMMRREGVLPYPAGYDIISNKVDFAMKLLNNVPSLANMSPEDDKYLAEHAEFLWYGPPECIVFQSEVENCMYIIAQGSVDVLVKQPDGSNLIVGHLFQNNIFGEMGLLTGAPRSATVRATSETLVCKISKTALQPIINNQPEVLSQLSEILAKRETATIQASSDYSEEQKERERQGAKERLMSLMGDFFKLEDDDLKI